MIVYRNSISVLVLVIANKKIIKKQVNDVQTKEAVLMPPLAKKSPVNRACRKMKSNRFLFAPIYQALHALKCSRVIV